MSIWREDKKGHVVAESNPWVFGGLIVGVAFIAIAILVIKAGESGTSAAVSQKAEVAAQTR